MISQDAIAMNAKRPRSHEAELWTPHYVEPGEIERAEAALARLSVVESCFDTDSPDWKFAIWAAWGLEGWISVAQEHGTTRRSFVRSMEKCMERAPDTCGRSVHLCKEAIDAALASQAVGVKS